MAIPFKSLRFPADEAAGVGNHSVSRHHRARPKTLSGRIFPTRVEGRLGQAATLYGLEGISPGRDIELIPYGVMRGFRALDTRDFSQSLFSEGRRPKASPAWTPSSSFTITLWST